MVTTDPDQLGGTIHIAGKTVSRIGFGTMRLTGPGTWGPHDQPDSAGEVLREAVHVHGITHLDTADTYGPHTVEELIREVLHPYPDDLLIATKVGMIRPRPNEWRPLGRPDYLRAAVEASLRRLDTETLDLCYLHRIDPRIPLLDQVGELAAMRDEGKIRHLGLSKVTVNQIREAASVATVDAVQNRLNRCEPDDPALDYCRDHSIPYIAYRPLDAGALAAHDPRHALDWILNLGDHTAPIPGTSSARHLRAVLNEPTNAETRPQPRDTGPTGSGT